MHINFFTLKTEVSTEFQYEINAKACTNWKK